MAEPYRFLVSVFAVWRITHLLHSEDGPFDVVVRLRRAAGTGVAGQMMDCFHCLSLWVAVPAALITGKSRTEKGLLAPALSAGAILLERVMERPRTAVFHEEREK